MTGLDLESFLQLLRADLGAWASLALVVIVLALMTWTSWGSRRALRKCLVLSIAAHVGLVLYGSTFPAVAALFRERPTAFDEAPPVRVQLAPTPGGTLADASEVKGRDGRSSRAVAAWDRAGDSAGLADPSIRPSAPAEKPSIDVKRPESAPVAPESVVLEVNPPPPTAAAVAPVPSPIASAAPADPPDVAPTVAARPAEPAAAETSIGDAGRMRRDRIGEVGPNPTELERRPESPSLVAAPAPAIPGVLSSEGTSPRPGMTPSAPPTGIALTNPSDVAAPKLGPNVSAPADGVSATGPGAQVRAREGTSPGVSPLTMLDPSQPSPMAGATVVAPPLSASRSGAPGVGSVASLGAPVPLAPSTDPSAVAPASPKLRATPAPGESLPEADTRRQSRPARETASLALNERRPETNLANLPRVAPSGAPALPATSGLTRAPANVPAIYRSRLDANRSALAHRAGASGASEEAVERALVWLARHQDADGRWDAATAKYRDGTVVEGDDDFTVHCPPGDVCFGECYYWEADTALTGLALLAYLGAGYTHQDGQHADTVARGLEYLRRSQGPDGDLRGRSRAVGLYCHAMATLALCEAYALTGDPKLRVPVERAVNFLVKARAQDGLAWRYAPGAPVGDTSILGWVVLCLKSAQEVGIPIAGSTRQGIATWLNKVSAGPSNGLARYQPWEKVTPTMTAEAWVCRQFLGLGGPGASAREAAEYLLRGGNEPERTQFNLYYLYYGTLAMYQHGGDAWSRWNKKTRDAILHRQRLQGHASGSWDPDESQYGTHGGRIYCTALATLSLEVYYRYLRLYDAPPSPPAPRVAEPRPRRTAEIISEPVGPR
jgi:hypothetical protein